VKALISSTIPVNSTDDDTKGKAMRGPQGRLLLTPEGLSLHDSINNLLSGLLILEEKDDLEITSG
jgi:hypothetical protein